MLPSILLAGCTLAPSTPQTVTGNQAQQAAQQGMKLAQIIQNGGSAVCTITNLSDNSTLQMTLSGKMIKVVGTTTGQSKGSMINDGNYVYTWQEGQATGYKTKVPSDSEMKETADKTQEPTEEQNSPESEASIYDDTTKYKTDCQEKKVSASEFVPPSDVKFTDTSSFSKMSPEDLQKYLPQTQK